MTGVFHRLPQSLWENFGIVLRLSHDDYLPNPFQFFIHLYSYHLKLYSLSSESDVAIQQRYEIPLLNSEVICADRQEHVYTIKKIVQ
jgi:hypothetical protein